MDEAYSMDRAENLRHILDGGVGTEAGAAQGAPGTNTSLQAQFHRLRSRRGAKKAMLGVAASMLTAAYHMLKNGMPYRDLGPEHFSSRDSSRDRSKAIQRLVRRLNDLGCEVHVAPQAA
jgi:hypothetical protein